MLMNVETARKSLAPYVENGVCSDSEKVLQYLNEACERLFDAGKWEGTIAKIRICHRAGVITLPREVETILEAADCGVPVQMNSEWYEFLPGGPWEINHCNPRTQMVDMGSDYCTTFDITGVKYLRVYSDLSVDNGKTILLQGTDENGNRVQTMQDGAWVDGEVFVLNSANPPISTVKWSNIESVSKELTTGYVTVVQVNTDTLGNVGLIAKYHPNDEFPTFRRVKYGAYCYNNCGDGEPTEKYHPLTFLCKKKFNPLVRETDMVPITASGALKNMVQALYYEKSNQIELAAAYEAKAIQILQNQLKQSQGAQVRMGSKIPGFGYRPAAWSFR